MDEDAMRVVLMRGALREDAEAVLAYGKAHPDLWTGISFEGSTLVVLTTNPDHQREALLQLVTHPEHVEIRKSKYSRSALDDIHSQVVAMIGEDSHRWRSHSSGLERARR